MLGMSVPAWLDDINPEHMSSLRKLLPDSSIIIKIEATGEIIHEYYQNIQRVKVLKVYKGEDIYEGNEIFIVQGMDQYDFNEMCHHTGFVNHCKSGQEYLVFIENRIDGVQKRIDPLYQVASFLITPIFSYTPVNHVIVDGVTIDDYYVSYKDIKNNHFFAGDQQALDNWLNLNELMTSKYP
jgi:hypothetical protein